MSLLVKTDIQKFILKQIVQVKLYIADIVIKDLDTKVHFNYYTPVVKVILILLVIEVILHILELLVDLNIISM